MTNIIFSPHIDDAFLSMGGMIHHLVEKKEEVRIEYIFSISDWTHAAALSGLEYEKDVEGVTDVRKKEEDNVSRLIKYEKNYWDLPDDPLRAYDTHISRILRDSLLAYFTDRVNRNDRIYLPLALGHPDHQLVKDTALELLGNREGIAFYEDLPYATFLYEHPHLLYDTMKTCGFNAHLCAFDAGIKKNYLQCYDSQLSVQCIHSIMNYSYSLTDNHYYERIWIPGSR